VFRPKRARFDVVEFKPVPFSDDAVQDLGARMHEHFTRDLLSAAFLRECPVDHPGWGKPGFGYCVPATFALLYALDTESLQPVRGINDQGEGHWWLEDIATGRRYDVVRSQFTDHEAEQIYATGRPTGYYGSGQAPAARFLTLIARILPDAVRDEIPSPIG